MDSVSNEWIKCNIPLVCVHVASTFCVNVYMCVCVCWKLGHFAMPGACDIGSVL